MEKRVNLNFVGYVGKPGSDFIPDGPLRVEMRISVYVDANVSKLTITSVDRGFMVPCNHCDVPQEVAREWNESGLTIDDVFDYNFHEGSLRVVLTDSVRKRHQTHGQYWEIGKVDSIECAE